MSSLQNHPLGHRASDVIAMWAGWLNRESMDTSQIIIIQSVPRAVTDSSDPIHIWIGFRCPKTTTIGREELCPTTTSSLVKRSRRYQIPRGEVSLNTDHVHDCCAGWLLEGTRTKVVHGFYSGHDTHSSLVQLLFSDTLRSLTHSTPRVPPAVNSRVFVSSIGCVIDSSGWVGIV